MPVNEVIRNKALMAARIAELHPVRERVVALVRERPAITRRELEVVLKQEFPDKANLPLSTLQNWLRYGRYGSYHYRKRRRVLPGGLAAQMSAFPADDVVAFMRAGNSAHAATKRFNIATEKQVQRLLFESGHPELCSPWYLRLRKHISTLPAESRPVTPSRGYTWSEIKEAVLVAFEKAARCAQLEAEVKRLAAENARLMSEMEEVRGTRRRKCEEEARFEAATQRGQGMPPFGSTQA